MVAGSSVLNRVGSTCRGRQVTAYGRIGGTRGIGRPEVTNSFCRILKGLIDHAWLGNDNTIRSVHCQDTRHALEGQGNPALLWKTPSGSARSAASRGKRNLMFVANPDDMLYLFRAYGEYHSVRRANLPAIIISVSKAIHGIAKYPILGQERS